LIPASSLFTQPIDHATMTKWILLIQGINVGGQKRMPMPELQSLLSDLGLQTARTYIQSGNAVFASPETDRALLGELIENAIGEKFGYTTPVFLRTAAEMARVAGENSFLIARSEDPSFLHVTFLSAPLTPETRVSLTAPAGIPDEMAPGLEEIYLFCPQGYGRTKLNNAFFERKLDQKVTTRNWNSVMTLLRMAEELP
jgi:uncharacterized protein (DUF1697 family)